MSLNITFVLAIKLKELQGFNCLDHWFPTDGAWTLRGPQSDFREFIGFFHAKNESNML